MRRANRSKFKGKRENSSKIDSVSPIDEHVKFEEEVAPPVTDPYILNIMNRCCSGEVGTSTASFIINENAVKQEFNPMQSNLISKSNVPETMLLWGNKYPVGRALDEGFALISRPLFLDLQHRCILWWCEGCARDSNMCFCQYYASLVLIGKVRPKPKIYLAPPCAGKTTFTNKNNLVIDGDTLYDFPGTRFWIDPMENEKVLTEWGRKISDYAFLSDIPVLVALDPKYIDPRLYDSMVFVVTPYWIRNMEYRVRAGKSKWLQEDIDRAFQIWTEILYKYHDIPIISSFQLVYVPLSSIITRTELRISQLNRLTSEHPLIGQ